ncbi:hypothetical protein [uncultured Phenylobacterium sp.]|uniref:hypothetical protein n=1 Tax=uncultured Phenylobacterium sp. TaxID=349273 RepID=UPI0026014C93|nr:hypothetical protein [uncultured Phenylobacterium sp.]
MVAIFPFLRRAALPALACALIAGTAAAADYVVVATTEPGLVRGATVEGGQRLAIAPGRSVTLMHASGALIMLKGAPAGVVAPLRKTASADTARLEVFRTMVSAKPRETSAGLGAQRKRGGVCPAPDGLTSLDAIAQVQAACPEAAAEALGSWLARTPAEEP